jgi:hypothetical protein
MNLLNIADQALIIDLIIAASKKSNCITICTDYLALIHKVEALELKPVKSELTMTDIFSQLDKLT